MAITYDAIMGYEVPDVTQTLSDADCILYALGVGFGTQPVHPGHLRHVYEEGLEVLPMMANVVAYPGFWLKDPATGVDWKRVLHGEQVFTIHRPIPIRSEAPRPDPHRRNRRQGGGVRRVHVRAPRRRRGGHGRTGLYP